MPQFQRIVLIVMAVLMVSLLIAAGAAFASRQPQVIAGDFVPPEFDANARKGTPDALDESRGYRSLEMKENAVVSLCTNITVENNAAQIYFTSHEKNLGWMKIKLLDDSGKVLGESGLLRPGEYLQEVHLDSVPKNSGLILTKILIYEPQTYLSLGSASAQVMLYVS